MQGLQAGVIDTLAAPLNSVIVLQWHTRLRYVLDLPMMYVYSVAVLSQSAWERLPPEDAETVTATLAAAVVKADAASRADRDVLREVLREQGLTFLRPTRRETRDWRARATVTAGRWVETGIVSADLRDRLVAYLEDQRTIRTQPRQGNEG